MKSTVAKHKPPKGLNLDGLNLDGCWCLVSKLKRKAHFPDRKNDSELIEQLGGPRQLRMGRTLSSAKEEVQAFFDKHGRRPAAQDLWNLNAWLSDQTPKSSVYLLANELVLPCLSRGPVCRTMASARAEIQAFWKEYGRRPYSRDLRNLDQWLRWQTPKSSVPRLANEMGLPGGINLSRTMASAKEEIQAFFDEYGRRPAQMDLLQLNQWLVRQTPKSSTYLLANELGLPGGYTTDRTMVSAKNEVKDFFNEHGRRPTSRDLPNVNSWLERQAPRSSIPRLANEMGLL